MKLIVKSSKDEFDYIEYEEKDKEMIFSNGKNSITLDFKDFKEKDNFEKEISSICKKGVVIIDNEMIHFDYKFKFIKVPLEIDYKVNHYVLDRTMIVLETSFGNCRINW